MTSLLIGQVLQSLEAFSSLSSVFLLLFVVAYPTSGATSLEAALVENLKLSFTHQKPNHEHHRGLKGFFLLQKSWTQK